MLGRPMPRSSSAAVSDASLKRAGGCVVWLFGGQLAAVERLADLHRRQHRLLIGQLGLGIVGAFDVGPQIAGEIDRLAADLKHAPSPSIVIVIRAAAGIGHLAGDRPLPDQVEQPEFVGVQLVLQRLRASSNGWPAGRIASWASWAFLTFDLIDCAAAAGRYSPPYSVAHQLAGGVDRHLRQVGRIGTHVSDVAVFVQALGDLHRPPGA